MYKITLFSLLFLALSSPLSGYEPTSQYEKQIIEGWEIYVNKTLIHDHPALCSNTLRLMKVKLYDIKRVVPAPAVKKLQTIPIWIEYKHPKHGCACFHPNKQWLINNDMNPEKEKSVEISNAKNFLKWTKHQPWMVLHELAHGYHFIFLKHDNQDVMNAFKKAKADKIYESVLRYNAINARHYGLNNVKEYFAESSEAYFGVNDFYPFIRPELKIHDPKMYEVIEKVWEIPK